MNAATATPDSAAFGLLVVCKIDGVFVGDEQVGQYPGSQHIKINS